MTFVDTSYLLALFNPGDSLWARATAWSEAADPPFVVTEPVLWEAVDAFSAPHHRLRAHTLFETIRTDEDFDIEWSSATFFEAAAALHASLLTNTGR